jgi:DHA2 family multidrug resistance protein
VGILGVFLGAGIATLNTRLLSVGLPDLRGATGFGYDQGSWIPTALSMATMFSGVFVVFVNALSGPRRILLPAAAIFAMVSLLLPFAPNYWVMLGLVTIAGVSSGTFYTLTMTFVLTALPKRLIILGIAAYAADIIFVAYSATALEGWYIEHLSWRWIFWTAAFVTPLMMICVYYGIPQRPRPDHRPSWRGFVYFGAGFGLLLRSSGPGERLDWLNSGVIVAMLAAGLLLVGAAVKGLEAESDVEPFVLKPAEHHHLRRGDFSVKFAQLADLMLVPAFLGNIQGTGRCRPARHLCGSLCRVRGGKGLVVALMIHTNSRLILTVGLTVAAVACWFCAQLDTSWAANNFVTMEPFMAVGFTWARSSVW